jgi:DNA-binding transcriptional LysR family regulator
MTRVRIRLVDLRLNQMQQRLRDGTLDFAITSQQHTQRLNLDWEALSRMRGLVVCRKNNPLRHSHSHSHSHSLRQLQFAKLDQPGSDTGSGGWKSVIEFKSVVCGRANTSERRLEK